MKTKLLTLCLGLLAMLLTTGMNGGCGRTYESISYFYPNWTVDGRIMAVKSFSVHRSEGLPGYGRDITESSGNYLVTMKDDGSDEKIVYGGANVGIENPVASPLGSYIAYGDSKTLYIITADGTREVKAINCQENLNSFDWSPDKTRIVYTGEDSRDMFIINISNEAKTKIATSAEAVAWRVGEKIAFVKFRGSDYSRISTVNSSGTGEVVTSLNGADVQRDDSRIYYRGSEGSSQDLTNAVRVCNLDGSSDALKISNYQISTLRLSFDGSKITGGKWSQGFPGGVWVVSFDGSNPKKLRD